MLVRDPVVVVRCKVPVCGMYTYVNRMSHEPSLLCKVTVGRIELYLIMKIIEKVNFLGQHDSGI